MDKFSKTDRLNNKLASLNLEKWLRLTALFIFILGLITLINGQLNMFDSLQRNNGNFLLLLPSFVMQFVPILYKPLILLGLAQIITLMKEKKNGTR